MFRVNIDPGIGKLESHGAADSFPVELRECTVNITFIAICSRCGILIEVLGSTVCQFPAVMDGEVLFIGPIVQGQRVGIFIPGIACRIFLLACTVVNIGLFDLLPDVVKGIAVGGFPLDLNILIAEVVIGFTVEGIFDCIIAGIIDAGLIDFLEFGIDLQVSSYRGIEVVGSLVNLPFNKPIAGDYRIGRPCNLVAVENSLGRSFTDGLESHSMYRGIGGNQRHRSPDSFTECVRLTVQSPLFEHFTVRLRI